MASTRHIELIACLPKALSNEFGRPPPPPSVDERASGTDGAGHEQQDDLSDYVTCPPFPPRSFHSLVLWLGFPFYFVFNRSPVLLRLVFLALTASLLTALLTVQLSRHLPLLPYLSFATGDRSSAAAATPPLAVLALYQRFYNVCAAPGANIVLARTDAINMAGSGMRPWSVLPQTFNALHPHCRTTAQLLDAVANGQRHYLPDSSPSPFDPPSSLTNESLASWPSYFVPAGCSLRWLDSDGVCEVLVSTRWCCGTATL